VRKIFEYVLRKGSLQRLEDHVTDELPRNSNSGVLIAICVLSGPVSSPLDFSGGRGNLFENCFGEGDLAFLALGLFAYLLGMAKGFHVR
jgi:hypothetical protein